MSTLAGLATSRGFAAGPVFVAIKGGRIVVPQWTVELADLPGEIARFRSARTAAKAQVDAMRNQLGRDAADELKVLTGHLELLDDSHLATRVEGCIAAKRINAEAALRHVIDSFRNLFLKMTDPYMRERIKDVDDVESRLLRILMGHTENPFALLDTPSVIVADELSPSDTAGLKRNLVLAFATDEGGTTSHVALLARALGIPAVTGLGSISSRVKAGDFVLVDGTNGAVTINPDLATRNEFDRMVEHERRLAELLSEDSACGGQLKDGAKIALLANSQPGVPMTDMERAGAEGIGLYRTEYLWLQNDTEPKEEEQFEVYSRAVRAAASLGHGARVVFRVLDIGGDKLPRMLNQREGNPFLGCRSIRWLLTHRDVFRTQLRAILRASAVGKAAVMYPMIADVRELREANSELHSMMRILQSEGIPFDPNLPHGAMIETPSAALNAAKFAAECDFFSIGTNDLIQYTMAADRGNGSVASLYQPANPAVLRLVEMTASAASNAHIPCCVCGETASDPVLGFLWVALGVTQLSMSAGFIPAQRKILKALTSADAEELAAYVHSYYDVRTADEIYEFCRCYLLDKVPHFEEIQQFFTRTAD